MRQLGDRRRGSSVRAFPLVLAIAALATAGSAAAHEGTAAHDTSGRSTLDQTIVGKDPTRGFSFLRLGSGEPYVVRSELAAPQQGREARRRSLSYFGQITDFQIPDEESPARVEFSDNLPGEMTGSAWRPHEAMVAHSVETSIRQLNHFLQSTVPQGDRSRASMDLAVMTGDLADNMQRNETEWVLRLLEGGTLDPSSGTKDLRRLSLASSQLCTSEADVQDFEDPRAYTGVQDYDDYTRTETYYDPDEPFGSTFGKWPEWAGLMDRAQVPFSAQGLKVPSYVLFGNHDGLVQGNEDAIRAYEDVATGCLKPLAPAFGESAFLGNMTPTAIAHLLESDPSKVMRVPPDERRQFVDKRQFKKVFASGQKDKHGFAFVDETELAESNEAASYYSWSPKPGLRFISLDTLSEGGSITDTSGGNLDHPQFQWLEAELQRAQENGELVVAFGHHAIGSLTAKTPDEPPLGASPCTVDDRHGHDTNPGCDRDPRLSTPLHHGEDLKELFLSHRNVISYVAGHSHENRVQPFSGAEGGGFWEIKSPAIADWPPQHRLIEIMDNEDGTLSIFGTMLDHDSPSQSPRSGPASSFDPSTLASVGRTITWNDPDQSPDAQDGERRDRNVELLIRDPRK
jgi:metallophosphoesterase (TIGR03767 family)